MLQLVLIKQKTRLPVVEVKLRAVCEIEKWKWNLERMFESDNEGLRNNLAVWNLVWNSETLWAGIVGIKQKLLFVLEFFWEWFIWSLVRVCFIVCVKKLGCHSQNCGHKKGCTKQLLGNQSCND